MTLTGENRQLGEKPAPVPLCPPQTPYGLTRDQTRVSAVRCRRLTGWAIERPGFKFALPLNAFTTVRCIETSSMWRIKGLYSAPRPALKGKGHRAEIYEQCVWFVAARGTILTFSWGHLNRRNTSTMTYYGVWPTWVLRKHKSEPKADVMWPACVVHGWCNNTRKESSRCPQVLPSHTLYNPLFLSHVTTTETVVGI
jgi:hypothetical protein